jgi:hypothetical protein
MGSMSPLVPTYEDYTGSLFTVNDAYVTTPPYGTTYLYPNGARQQPGRAFYATWTPTGSSTAYWLKCRYVQYNPTAAVTFTSGSLPPVYWKDTTFTVVTPTATEGTAYNQNGVAGILLNTTTTSANLSKNWTLIAVAGYMTSMISASAVAVGDMLIGSTSAQTVVRVAQGTSPTGYKVIYMATSAVASSLSNGIIMCEDICPPV